MEYGIVALPKEKWKGAVIPMVTRSGSYYDIEMSPLNGEGCKISLVRKQAIRSSSLVTCVVADHLFNSTHTAIINFELKTLNFKLYDLFLHH